MVNLKVQRYKSKLKNFFILSCSFALFILTFALLTFPVSAQNNPPTTNYEPITTNYSFNQGPHLASEAIYNFSHAMSCILIGQSPIAPCLEYKMVKDATGMVKSVPYLNTTNTSNGLLGVSLSMVGEVISTPPIRSSEFIANFSEQIGIKSANAQVGGSGSGVLAPIFKLWEVSRNISYLAMIVIFIGVGFMVMFRQKLNPQTVVSVQLALPGLVIGLVMITFSYFLAALISDLAFVGTNVVGYYFSLAQTPVPPATSVTPTVLPLMSTPSGKEDNILSIFSRYTGILGMLDIKRIVDSIWPYLDDPKRGNLPLVGGLEALGVGMDPQQAISTLTTMIAVQFILPFGALWGGKGQAWAAGLVTGAKLLPGTSETLIAFTLSWAAMLALIYSMLKLLLRLIQNLLSIIFLTIAAPFYFLATSLPGKQGLLPNWFFNMLCNVLAFPAVFGVFYFIAFILGGQTSAGITDPLFKVGAGTTIAGTTTFPLLGALDTSFLNKLMAFGALMALPSIPDIICRVVGKPNQLGALAAGAVGGAIASGQRYQGQLQSGTSGLVGNVGRLNSAPGYSGVADAHGNVTWTKTYDPRFGAQIGQKTKFLGGIGGLANTKIGQKVPLFRRLGKYDIAIKEPKKGAGASDLPGMTPDEE